MDCFNIPLITLSTVLLLTLCFVQPQLTGLINYIPYIAWPHPSRVCLGVHVCFSYEEWDRLLLAGVYHSSGMHLYYNIASFIWKSRQLEHRIGSVLYAILLALIYFCVNLTYLLINSMLAKYYNSEYAYHCVIGFSGVIFSLKTILAILTPNRRTSILGIIQLPLKYACWIELVIISILIPSASFVGHLAGILVGAIAMLIYNKVWKPVITAKTTKSQTLGRKVRSYDDQYQRDIQTAITKSLSESKQGTSPIRIEYGSRLTDAQMEEMRKARLSRFT